MFIQCIANDRPRETSHVNTLYPIRTSAHYRVGQLSTSEPHCEIHDCRRQALQHPDHPTTLAAAILVKGCRIRGEFFFLLLCLFCFLVFVVASPSSREVRIVSLRGGGGLPLARSGWGKEGTLTILRFFFNCSRRLGVFLFLYECHRSVRFRCSNVSKIRKRELGGIEDKNDDIKTLSFLRSSH